MFYKVKRINETVCVEQTIFFAKNISKLRKTLFIRLNQVRTNLKLANQKLLHDIYEARV